MADPNDERKCEERCDEIIQSIKEYSAENITDLDEAKEAILQLLKTHRPVKLGDFDYGLSYALKKDYRLIIKEENDKSQVLEYGKNKENWSCCLRCRAPLLKFKYGILFAPKDHKCKPKDYSFVMKVQDFLKQGNTLEAKRLRKKRSMINKNDSKSINPTFNESNSTSLDTTNMEDESIVEESILAQSQRSSSVAESGVIEAPARSNVKIEPEIDDLSPKKPKIEPISGERVPFYRPSDSILKQICQKLKIDYDNEAYKLWGDIAFNEILSTSNNLQTHEIKSQNLFACISMFFTGQIRKCYSIQETINTAFCDELTKTGTKTPSEIGQAFTNTTVSDEYLEFIAKFLACRVGIYENGNLKKFGKWKTKNDILTLMFGFVDGFYSIVLDL